MTVLLEYIDCLLQLVISVVNISINEFYIFPIMLALCLMLSVTHYAQNYAGIIGGSLHTDAHTYVYTHTCNITHNVHRNL